MRRHRLSVAITLAVVLVGLAIVTLTGTTPQLGLDLKGGFAVVLEPAPGQDVDSGALDVAVDIISSRVDALGVSEPVVRRQGDGIVVELPGIADREQACRVVGTVAELQFRPVIFGFPELGGALPGTPDEALLLLAEAAAASTSTTTTAPTTDTTTPPTATSTTAASGSEGSTSTTGAAPTTVGPVVPTTVAGAQAIRADEPTTTTSPVATTATTGAADDGTTTTISAATPAPATTDAATDPCGDADATTSSSTTPTSTTTASTTTSGASTPTTSVGESSAPGTSAPAAGSVTSTTVAGAQAVAADEPTSTSAGPTTTTSAGATTTTSAGATTTTAPPDPAALRAELGIGDVSDPQANVLIPGRPIEGQEVSWYLGPVVATGEIIEGAQARLNIATWYVEIDFTGAGGETFDQVAQAYVGRQVAIVLDGVVQSAPTIQEANFGGSATITGDFSEGEAKDLALVLRYGRLPVELEIVTQQQISATLGRDQLDAGIVAGIVGFLLVASYMMLWYRVLGLVIIATLGLTAAVLYTVVSWLGATQDLTLTLAGVTGLIVATGLAVDSNIVYFERLKDEVKRGASVRSAPQRGFRQAFRTIVAADIVSLLAAVMLWLIAVGSVRGFAFYLGLASLVDLALTYVFMHPLVSLLVRNRRMVGWRWFGIAAALHADAASSGSGPAEARVPTGPLVGGRR